MFDKDKSSWGSSSKKEKKEKPQRVNPKGQKSEVKKLFGGGNSFGGGSSFGKSSSFGSGSSFGKEMKEKPHKEKKSFGGSSGGSFSGGEKESLFKRLKWWHILLTVLGVLIVTVAIIAAVIFGKISNAIPNGNAGNNNGNYDTPITEGVVTSIGTYLSTSMQEYVLCEYNEYFSNSNIIEFQKPNNIRYEGKAYYVLVENGKLVYDGFSGEYTGEYTPEETKEALLSLLKTAFEYTDEQISLCDVHIYEPVSFTRVAISSATIAEDGSATIKYKAGAVDGEMSEEYELIATYIKTDNDFDFIYAELPEDENLRLVAEKLLATAKYEYYAQYGSWVNVLRFGDYSLYLTTSEQAESQP